MRIDVIETPDLGDRSYVVSDSTCAIVVDPQRDLDRVRRVLADRGVPVVLVLETHLHNDYVTGGHALAQQAGATYVVCAEDDVAFERQGVRDGDELTAGTMAVQVLATPGHTATHVSYVVSDGTGAPAAFTGGSLLYGSVGRTDLLGEDRTDELTRAQWRSARRLAELLPDDAPVYPTHGFGSFCSSGSASGGDASTIGHERQVNDALTTDDEQEFVDALVAGLTGYPAYYVHMAPLNAAGPHEPDLSPPSPVDPAELARRLHVGEWVVDLRERRAYAGRHLAGTVSIALSKQFSTYIGWLMPWGAPLTLIGGSAQEVAEAQRQLVRIGVDRLAGAATGQVDELGSDLRSYRVVSFADLAQEQGATVLDVRRHDERRGGGIEGSLHVPLDELVGRADELPREALWVHCASGFRAAIAASLLERAGHEVVHVDDDISAARDLGLLA